MTEEERKLRVKLAACYRIFAHLGWDELIYNHITVKIPGSQGQFLINPYGLHYSEVTASNLLKVNVKGEKIDQSPHQPTPAGMIIHTAIHSAREDAVCIGHLHTDAGSVVACQQNGLRHDNFYSVLLHGQVAYHDFEGITVMPGEQERLVASLGDKSLLILRNHGLLACGNSIEDMFMRLWLLQRACEIQVAADASGQPLIPIDQSIAEKTAQLLKLQTGPVAPGVLEFNALLRKIDRLDNSYKE